MMVERIPELEPLLEGVPAPPEALIADARAVPPGAAADRRRRRLALGGLGVALLVAIGISPAGSATADLIGELAGFGEEPTLPQPHTVPGSARVVDRGVLADGSRWELVTKNSRSFGANALCFSITWPEAGRQDIDSYCTRSSSDGKGNEPPLSAGIQFPPGAKEDGPGLMFGFADSQDVASVETAAVTAAGSRAIETETIQVAGEPLEAAGGTYPVTLYLGELSPDDLAAAASGEQNIVVIARDDEGNELDRHLVLVPNARPEVSQQQTIEIFPELPNELRQLAGLDPAPLSAAEREELISPGYDGAMLADAVDLFMATPKVQAEKRKDTAALDEAAMGRGRGPLPPLIRSGALRLPSGEPAYYVFSATFAGGPGHVGIYAADDLSVIRFEERPGR